MSDLHGGGHRETFGTPVMVHDRVFTVTDEGMSLQPVDPSRLREFDPLDPKYERLRVLRLQELLASPQTDETIPELAGLSAGVIQDVRREIQAGATTQADILEAEKERVEAEKEQARAEQADAERRRDAGLAEEKIPTMNTSWLAERN